MEWGPDQSKAFQQLKNYFATRLLVTVPDPEAPLLLYVAASDHAVSGVLVQEKEEEPTTYLLHFRCLVRSKVELYRDRKNSICSVDLFKKIEALFLGT